MCVVVPAAGVATARDIHRYHMKLISEQRRNMREPVRMPACAGEQQQPWVARVTPAQVVDWAAGNLYKAAVTGRSDGTPELLWRRSAAVAQSHHSSTDKYCCRRVPRRNALGVRPVSSWNLAEKWLAVEYPDSCAICFIVILEADNNVLALSSFISSM